MKEQKKNIALNIIFFIFLLIAINQVFVMLLTAKNFRYAFWFSDHVAFVLAIAVLMRKRAIVTGEMCIALIPETIWTLDFLGKILFNRFIFNTVGVANYLFVEGAFVARWQNFSTLQHLFILPLGLLALWIMKADKNGWRFALIHAAALWIISFAIGSAYNVNCIFDPCALGIKKMGYYMIIWPLVIAFFIMASNLFLTKIFKEKKPQSH